MSMEKKPGNAHIRYEIVKRSKKGIARIENTIRKGKTTKCTGYIGL